jgi:hypothetical protein
LDNQTPNARLSLTFGVFSDEKPAVALVHQFALTAHYRHRYNSGIDQ